MFKITEAMKQKALSEAPAGWYTNLCPECGEAVYTLERDKGAHLTHEPCNAAFIPIDMGERMYNCGKAADKNTIREHIRTAQRLEEDGMTGKTVTVSICPECGSYAWNFDGNVITCAHCRPEQMNTDAFVL